MKSTVVYIHGFDSSPNSSTAQVLRTHYSHEKFLCPAIDHRSDPDKLQAQFDALGKRLMRQDDVVVVGSSAGGLWADYMAIKYGLKTVLINPALSPSTLFPSFDLPAEYIVKYKKLERYLEGRPRHHTVVFSGTGDDVVPSSVVKHHHKNTRLLAGVGHRLTDYKPVFAAVDSFIGNWPEVK